MVLDERSDGEGQWRVIEGGRGSDGGEGIGVMMEEGVLMVEEEGV